MELIQDYSEATTPSADRMMLSPNNYQFTVVDQTPDQGRNQPMEVDQASAQIITPEFENNAQIVEQMFEENIEIDPRKLSTITEIVASFNIVSVVAALRFFFCY
jgi:hypothetical protein